MTNKLLHSRRQPLTRLFCRFGEGDLTPQAEHF